jgi:transcriptional regulator with XRE-family HTH domain
VASAQAALAKRIRELRRRHFGARGKPEFARRLGVRLEQYEAYERNRVPPGDLMVRICEVTGEDLQWLLTGKPSRDALMISGVRPRHRHLLTRATEALNRRPELAAPFESFLDLLTADERLNAQRKRQLKPPAPTRLIPVFEPGDVPELPPSDQDWAPAAASAARALPPSDAHCRALLLEPEAEEIRPGDRREVRSLEAPDQTAGPRWFLESPELSTCFPDAFAVVLRDETMRPMFEPGDAALVAPGCEPVVGRPVLCRLADDPPLRCRVWLGQEADCVNLGRVADGEHERVSRDRLRWSFEVLFRVVPRG